MHDFLCFGPACEAQPDQLERADDQQQVAGCLSPLLVMLDGLACPGNPLDGTVSLGAGLDRGD
jgi:hypothetical protein